MYPCIQENKCSNHDDQLLDVIQSENMYRFDTCSVIHYQMVIGNIQCSIIPSGPQTSETLFGRQNLFLNKASETRLVLAMTWNFGCRMGNWLRAGRICFWSRNFYFWTGGWEFWASLLVSEDVLATWSLPADSSKPRFKGQHCSIYSIFFLYLRDRTV